MMPLQYTTINGAVQELLVEKKSKFICDLLPIRNELEAADAIDQIRKKYYDAKHHCYAYLTFSDGKEIERSSDDGEPSGTAGKPILEVLRGAGLRNTLAVVTRYFGGTLLGTGGLIKAYTEAAQGALKKANLFVRKKCNILEVYIDYGFSKKLEHFFQINDVLTYKIEYFEQVHMTVLIHPETYEPILEQIKDFTNGTCRVHNGGIGYYDLREGCLELEIINESL